MAEPIYVKPGDQSYFSVRYMDHNDPTKKAELENAWKHFNRYDPATEKYHYIWYRSTNRKSEILADYRMPPNSPVGLYRIETFVPGWHATTKRAIFTIANHFRIKNERMVYDDTICSVNMYNEFDVWVSLGVFLLDPKNNPLSGRVRQHNLSLEEPPASVSFGPVRWIPLATQPVPIDDPDESPLPTPPMEEPPVPSPTPTPVPPPSPRPEGAARFDAPVGTKEAREGALTWGVKHANLGPVWLENWFDYTPFLKWYVFGYHTGADLNLTTSPSADRDAPVYAAAEGTVVYAGEAGSWGKIIVLEHPDGLVTLPNGKTQRQRIFSRYGHVGQKILVSKGDAVERGQKIGVIGLMRGRTNGWHLHFDISHSDILKNRPAHWPNLSEIKILTAQGKTNTRDYYNAQLKVKREVLAHYVDPYKFTLDNH